MFVSRETTALKLYGNHSHSKIVFTDVYTGHRPLKILRGL